MRILFGQNYLDIEPWRAFVHKKQKPWIGITVLSGAVKKAHSVFLEKNTPAKKKCVCTYIASIQKFLLFQNSGKNCNTKLLQKRVFESTGKLWKAKKNRLSVMQSLRVTKCSDQMNTAYADV